MLQFPDDKSFFLLGPRGTGKTTWVRAQFPKAVYIDLLDMDTYALLLAKPHRLEEFIPVGHTEWVVIDEVQKVPELLNEVHRLIEGRRLRFVLTGSSARSLRRKGVNLLAGRALVRHMYPFTAVELGETFDLSVSVQNGHLPSVYTESRPQEYLRAYVQTYLREEVLQEGLTRNIGAFTRFLETASFSQGSVLNVSHVARECSLNRKTVEAYFDLADDLLLSVRLPVFSKRAKRKVVGHPKFYFFDAGVYRSLRPRGPVDTVEEGDGAALESLILQELRATNDNLGLEYNISFWRTKNGLEVDFVLYGPNGFHAFEVKRSKSLHPADFRGLKAFGEEYPEATLTLLYGGEREMSKGPIRVLSIAQALKNLPEVIG